MGQYFLFMSFAEGCPLRGVPLYACRSSTEFKGDIVMQTCPSYDVHTTGPTTKDHIYEEYDKQDYEEHNYM